MGEAPDEAEARLQITRQQGRASVTFSERSGRYRWTVVLVDMIMRAIPPASS